MTQRVKKRSARITLKKRREEILERFLAFGLTRGPHRIVHTGRMWDGEASLGHKLRLAFSDLGPVFSSFGLYLSTRVDLLSAGDCLELARIPDEAPPMFSTEARDLIARETGSALEDAFLSWESEPFESRLLYQSHRARLLQNARPVVVRLVRPEAARQFLCDLELLKLLEGTLGGASRSAIYESAMADFAVALHQQINLTHDANALEMLQRDTEDFEMLRVPKVERDLCASSVLTLEDLPGIALNDVLDSEIYEGASKERHDQVRILDRPSVARLLCSAWLRQALLGHVFPTAPSPSNITVISDRQIAFTGGGFASLPGESQSNLWKYLIASAGDNPDQACSCLLKEMRRAGSQSADEDLRHRFRQVVPFRDSGWYRDDDTNQLVEHLVVHWQAAADCGHVPLPHLPSFFRGLFAITSAAQQLSPETDPLMEGLQEARLLASAAQMRDMFSLQHLGDHVDKYAAIMMTMPQRFDQLLTLASEGTPRVKLHVPETSSGRRQKNSVAVMTAMLFLLAAVAFALPRVTGALVGNEWAGRINATVFIACGALLLMAAGRTR
jgi:predicted unusual protein kinase regulating ubiquinone biosynthesis (AarF/ABC1/UbiB family)